MSSLVELKFKIILLGDSGVGKAPLILRYVDNYFPDTQISTMGVEYKTKTLIKGKYKITLDIWDTAGQERFRSITKSFFSNTAGIIYVYDITKRDSFSGSNGIKNWIKDAEEYGTIPGILCGTNLDKENKRQVKYDELKELGIKKNMDCFEVSAKTGKNVNEVFEKLLDSIIKSRSEKELIQEFEVKIKPRGETLTGKKEKSTKKKGCHK